MELKLKGKRALVTGASNGIGFAVARSLAGEGCNVDIASRDFTALETAAEKIHATTPEVDVRIHCFDLSIIEDQQQLARICAKSDILINNAGAAPAGSLGDTTDAMWRDSWGLKVFGYVNLSRMFYCAMKERRDGVILNIIGYAGERLNARYIIGTTGNAALMAFTRSVGSQSPDFGVRVVGVNPGYTATSRAQDQLRAFATEKYGSSDRWREIEHDLNLPFGRMATPQEVANVVTFLVSPQASYISGTVVTVDGGATHRND
jgi:3-oxoacyl-[acyl-carrier protein] reductase